MQPKKPIMSGMIIKFERGFDKVKWTRKLFEIGEKPLPPLSTSFVTTAERKYGRNVLGNLFDTKAKDTTLLRPYAYVLKTAKPEDGFDIITYYMVANAINRASWWLVREVGLEKNEVFAYMGPPDLRYLTLSLAAAKTGRKVCTQQLPDGISSLYRLVNE
jgi:hypothetical protein